MRKKKKSLNTNPINTMHVIADFDYDRLADAIIKAKQEPPQTQTSSNGSELKLSKKIWLILTGKKNTKDVFTIGLFSFLTGLILRLIFIVGIIILFGYIIVVPIHIYYLTWTADQFFNNILSITLCLLIFVMILVFTFMSLVASREVVNSNDKNLVLSTFSNLTSFIALVVALIALFKT